MRKKPISQLGSVSFHGTSKNRAVQHEGHEHPTDRVVRVQNGITKTSQGVTDRTRAALESKPLSVQGQIALREGSADEAFRLFMLALAESPEDINALAGMTELAVSRSDWRSAFVFLSRELCQDVKHRISRYLLLVEIVSKSEDREIQANAVKFLEDATRAFPDKPLFRHPMSAWEAHTQNFARPQFPDIA